MIALIAAVPLETTRLRRDLRRKSESSAPFVVFEGQLGGRRAHLIHAGVGKANAAMATAWLTSTQNPELVISFGCGGSYPGTELEVGDLALATESVYGDEGVLAPRGFLDMETIQLPLADLGGKRLYNRFPVARDLLEPIRPALVSAVSPSRTVPGPIVTVSTCSGTLAGGQILADRTGGIAENMEGAAVAHVCALWGVPFLEFRGISNRVEDRDTSRWDLASGSETAQTAVLETLEILREKRF